RRRGQVTWFLMTSRPDLVPVDLKRQGRAEEHIALFPPATLGERVQVFEALRRRLKIPLEPGTDVAALLTGAPATLSAADIEGILVRASRKMASAGAKTLSGPMLTETVRDFKPPAYPLEIEYQRLIAAVECTSRRLLPPDLAQMSPGQIATRLSELRVAMGRN
ncbi:MAG: AAA family ATPase, partial [Gemmatimonadota bacterium]